jgi:hypothetical protein
MLVALASLGLAACGTPAGTPVLRAGHEAWFLSTVQRAATQADCAGVAVTGIRLTDDQAEVALTHDAGESSIRLRHPSSRCRDCVVSGPFAIDHDPADRCAGAMAAALQQVLGESDPPDVWMRVGKPAFATGEGIWLFLAGWGALAVLAAILGRRNVRWELALIGGMALALRLLLATWGPGDLQLNLHADMARVYGAAPYAVVWALEALFQPDDLVTVLVPASAVLGTLVVVILALFLREAGASRAVAATAAFLLALHPLAVRWSGDCERQMYVLVSQAIAFLAVAAALRRDRWWPLAGFAFAGLLATYSRPEGLAVWAGAGFVALVLPWSRKTLAVLGIAVAGIGLGLLRFVEDFLVQVDSAMGELDFLPPVILDPGYTPVALMALFVLGVVVAFRAPRNRLVLGLALLALLSSLPALFHPTWGLRHASTRYQLQALMPFVAVAALGLATVTERLGRLVPQVVRGWTLPVTLLLVAAASIPTVIRVTRPVSVDNEFAFLRRTLPDLPRRAVVFYAHPDNKVGDVAGFRGMEALSDWLGRGDISWRLWDDSAPRTPPPAFFYRQPACLLPTDPTEDAPKGHPEHECLRCVVERCRQGLAHSAPEPLAEATFPAVHFGLQRFTAPEATVGFYPLLQPSP